MNELTTVQQNNAIEAKPFVGAELFARYIAYLDSSPKTVETYTRALRQLFSYFSLNGITQPQREDIIAFRDELKASGHKPFESSVNLWGNQTEAATELMVQGLRVV